MHLGMEGNVIGWEPSNQSSALFVVAPHSQDLDDPLLIQHLIHHTLLNVDST